MIEKKESVAEIEKRLTSMPDGRPNLRRVVIKGDRDLQLHIISDDDGISIVLPSGACWNAGYGDLGRLQKAIETLLLKMNGDKK